MAKTSDTVAQRKKHRVTASMRVLELTRAGSAMKLKVYADGEQLGEITIGQGSLTWRGGKRRYQVTMDWSEFAQLMNRYYDR